MNKLNLILTSIIIATSAYSADVVWVKTKFWQSPYPKSAEAKILNSSFELVKACQELRDLVFTKNGTVRVIRASQIEFLRALPLPSSFDTQFSTLILTNLPKNGSVLNQADSDTLFSSIIIQGDLITRPGYNQKTEEVVIDYSSASPFEIEYTDQSISKVSHDFNLDPLPITLIQKSNGLYLKISGMDNACDLLSGQVKLKSRVKAAIKISLEQQIKLNEFYTAVEKSFEESQKRYRTNRARAASFGVKLGNILEKSPLSSEKLFEYHLGVLMDDLFTDDSLTQSSLWKQNGSNKVLSVDGTSDPVSIQLIIK